MQRLVDWLRTLARRTASRRLDNPAAEMHPAKRLAIQKRDLERACSECGVSRTVARRIARIYFKAQES